jgi:hypothetical protein
LDKPAQWVICNVMAEEEFKGNGQAQPDDANGQSLL